MEAEPVIGCGQDGAFAASWLWEDGSNWGVKARSFAEGALPNSLEKPVNATTTAAQDLAAIGRDALGNFVVVWRDFAAEGAGNGIGIRARMFDAAGDAAPEFAVNSHLPGNQDDPEIARSTSGNFVVVWNGIGPGDVNGVWMRRFDAGGTPLGAETLVVASGTDPSIALNPLTGGYVVAWDFYNGVDVDVRAQRFDASGVSIGGVIDVNTTTTGRQARPVVAADGAGNFVVLYEGSGLGDSYGVLGQLFSAVGVPTGSEFWVYATIADDQFNPEIAFDAAGAFMVLWTTKLDARRYRVDAAHFSPSGARSGSADLPLTATLAAGHSQISSDICSDGARTFRAVIEEEEADLAHSEIFSQRLVFGVLADGFESGDTGAWIP